jgi:hypothetical protein
MVAGGLCGIDLADSRKVFALSTLARLDYHVVSGVVVGVGATGRLVEAREPGSSLRGATGGLTASAYLAVPLGPRWELSVGPRLDALVRPVIVEVSDREVFRVPSFIGGLELDLAWWLLGARGPG